MHFAFWVCRLCLDATLDFEVGYRRVPYVLFSGTDYFDYFRFFAPDRSQIDRAGGGVYRFTLAFLCVLSVV